MSALEIETQRVVAARAFRGASFTAASSSAGRRRGMSPETPRPLQLLWDHRELGGDHAVPLRSTQPVAEVVESPRWTVTHVLAGVSSARGTLCAPRSHRRPFHLSS